MFYYEIDFADFKVSSTITKKIEAKLQKLIRHSNRIISAHVTVRLPHRHRNKHIYHIQVQLDVPGHSIVVNREPEMNYAHSDINVAIRDVFDKVTRKLDEVFETRRERPHPAAGAQHAYVLRFDPNSGYGFVVTADGEEIYFNANSLVGSSLDHLKAGVEVRINTEEGEQGLQVSSLQVVGGHRVEQEASPDV